MNLEHASQLTALDFRKADGLIAVVVQNGFTGELLMLGYADEEALRRTLDSGELWLYSRSRAEHWHKGATSGNTQRVLSMSADCDRDAVLVRVAPAGPACHTGARSCFTAAPTLVALADVIAQRAAARPDDSYTARLLADANLRLKKLGEEAVELALACREGERPAIAAEAADLLYHVLVACQAAGVSLEDISARLERRLKPVE